MSDLAEFVLARIAEDVAANDAMVRDEVVRNRADGMPSTTEADVRDFWGGQPWWRRRLAECEAKRRIVEEHHQLVQYRDEPPYPICPTCSDDPGGSGGSVPFPCPTLGFLALPYADHPDYRQDWRP